MMKIRSAEKNDIEQLYSFGKRMYPERDNYKEIIDFWLSKGEDEIENIVVAVDENEKIRGQQFFSSMNYFFNGSVIKSTWAFDLIVDEELRAGSQGFSLMWKCKKIHPNSMSSGSNDISLHINLKIGNTQLGELKKYVGITNPAYLLTSFFKGIVKREEFPDQIVCRNRSFKKVKDFHELPQLAKPFNENLLEIGRDKEFLQWRFFSDLHQYAFYVDGNDYFVARTIVKKHITALVLVDYRCKITPQKGHEDILKSFRQLAKKMKLGVIITGSSHKMVDLACEKMKMKAIGRNRPILGFLDCKGQENNILNRNFILLTLADSDGEITW